MCGSNSILELLIGQQVSHMSPCDSHVISPYIPMASNEDNFEPISSTSLPLQVNDGEVIQCTEVQSTGEVSSDKGSDGSERKMVFSGGILKPLLSLLRAKLTKETWKQHPTAKHALVWSLRQLKVGH